MCPVTTLAESSPAPPTCGAIKSSDTIQTRFLTQGPSVPSSTFTEEGEKLFQAHRKVIEQVIEYVSRKERLPDAEAQEFESYAYLRLVANDYAILRRFKGDCKIGTYLSVVVGRLLLDWRIKLWGKWHPSAEAKRLGDVAVALETIIHRDNRSIEEALPHCQRIDSSVTLARLQELAARLPERRRKMRTVGIDAVPLHELSVPSESVLEAAFEADRAEFSRKAGAVVRKAMAGFTPEDRLLVRLVYGAEMSIAQAARTMKTDQKPLYRRLIRCLKTLKRRLEETGITDTVVDEILSGKFSLLDFNLSVESRPPCPSLLSDHLGEKAEDLR